MRLSELEKYGEITIQCHDNPDGDAIASGYGLYVYFKEKGKKVRFIYSGGRKIQKSNLVLMTERLDIPIEYVGDLEEGPIKGLLITVDCQYGAGNVTKLPAEQVAIIDHHQIEITDIDLQEIQPNLGSCSTLVWKMMKEEGFSFKEDTKLGTALYYGLFSDTNQFAEIYNPVDMDMRDDVAFNKSLITLFRNSNLTLKELEIAGIALIRNIFNDDYNYAIIKAQPCDPNILGLISDFLLQVDTIHTCVVYNELPEGYKISVRSCSKEVKASELAAFITEGIGSGGGHLEKAGGFISKKRYEEEYPTLHSEAYFSEKMNEYFDNIDIIYAREYDIDVNDMKSYVKKQIPLGYAKAEEIFPIGTPITIRTLEGDIDNVVKEDMYIMIGIKGEVHPIKKEKFEKTYRETEENFLLEAEYIPTIKNRNDGISKNIMCYAKTCIATGEAHIHAKELTKTVKVFTTWDEEKYMLGKPGDFIAVRCEDKHDIYIVERDIFFKTYEETDAI